MYIGAGVDTHDHIIQSDVDPETVERVPRTTESAGSPLKVHHKIFGNRRRIVCSRNGIPTLILWDRVENDLSEGSYEG
jgi:hypothetical protein